MSIAFTGTQHLLGSPTATAPAFAMSMHLTTGGGQARKFMVIGNSGSASNYFGMLTDLTSSTTNKLSVAEQNAGGSGQDLSGVLDVVGNWNQCITQWATTSSRQAWLNGANKVSGSGAFTNPTGLDSLVVSGRATDFTGGIGGSAAHGAVWTRALSDTEALYIGTGGNPRNVKGTVSYWKMTAAEISGGTVIDQIGTNNLTVVGSPSAGGTNPNLQTYRTGSAVGNLSYTAGTAIASINVGSSGTLPIFDDVSSAFTSTLCQLGAPTSLTTTTGAITAVREIPLTSGTGFAAGDYLKLTSGGTPTRILAMNGLIALVADDQTASSGAAVFRFAVNPLTIAGLSISGNVFSGTPTASAVNNLCLFRAACTANSALKADSDVFTITITGGTGGSGLLMPAGSMSGGFSGG